MVCQMPTSTSTASALTDSVSSARMRPASTGRRRAATRDGPSSAANAPAITAARRAASRRGLPEDGAQRRLVAAPDVRDQRRLVGDVEGVDQQQAPVLADLGRACPASSSRCRPTPRCRAGRGSSAAARRSAAGSPPQARPRGARGRARDDDVARRRAQAAKREHGPRRRRPPRPGRAAPRNGQRERSERQAAEVEQPASIAQARATSR